MLALIYGGSGSGKSELAEKMLSEMRGSGGPLLYIATMFPDGGESRERIARHRSARAHKGFATIERYTNIEGLTIPDGSRVLLECLGNLVANELFSPDGAGGETLNAVLRGLEKMQQSADSVIVVSNDVSSDGVAYPPETEEYRRVLAALNRSIARGSSLVAETVCGIPLWHKENGAWSA